MRLVLTIDTKDVPLAHFTHAFDSEPKTATDLALAILDEQLVGDYGKHVEPGEHDIIVSTADPEGDDFGPDVVIGHYRLDV